MQNVPTTTTAAKTLSPSAPAVRAGVD